MATGNIWRERMAPALEDLEVLAREAFDGLPAEFRRRIGDVTFAIAEFPDDETLDALEIESPFDLLGLFQGVGMAHDAASPETGRMPNRILLFRRPILDYWCEHEETLAAVVSHVLVHEIGHHFGLSDDDMEAIEEAAD